MTTSKYIEKSVRLSRRRKYIKNRIGSRVKSSLHGLLEDLFLKWRTTVDHLPYRQQKREMAPTRVLWILLLERPTRKWRTISDKFCRTRDSITTIVEGEEASREREGGCA